MKKTILFEKNLSNKQPTKDITEDDIKYKLKKSITKKEIKLRFPRILFFQKLYSRNSWSNES